MRDSTALVGDDVALRSQYQRDGYLLLRGVLDPSLLWTLRGLYFSRFDPSYLRPGTDPCQGVYSGRRPPGLPAHGTAGHPAYAFVREEPFAQLVSPPALERLAEKVLGGPVRRLPRAPLRHFDCHAPLASRAHVDRTYLDQGSEQVATMWIPIGDCSRSTGSLVYLEGSADMDHGLLEELATVTDRPDDPRPISHNLAWVAERSGRRWLWADFRAGDVAVHAPGIIHASLDTTTEEMRLSADVRFVAAGQKADPRWLSAWAGDDGF
jgi:hypothetical protein